MADDKHLWIRDSNVAFKIRCSSGIGFLVIFSVGRACIVWKKGKRKTQATFIKYIWMYNGLNQRIFCKIQTDIDKWERQSHFTNYTRRVQCLITAILKSPNHRVEPVTMGILDVLYACRLPISKLPYWLVKIPLQLQIIEWAGKPARSIWP